MPRFLETTDIAGGAINWRPTTTTSPTFQSWFQTVVPIPATEPIAAPAEPEDKSRGFVRGKPRKSPKSDRFYSVYFPIVADLKDIKSRLRLKHIYGMRDTRSSAVMRYRDIQAWRKRAKESWRSEWKADEESLAQWYSRAVSEIRRLRELVNLPREENIVVSVYFAHKDSYGIYRPFIEGGPVGLRGVPGALAERTKIMRYQALDAARRSRRAMKQKLSNTTSLKPSQPGSRFYQMGYDIDPRLGGPGGVHMEPGWFGIQQFNRSSGVLHAIKTPGDVDKFVGVEIECYTQFERHVLECLLRKAALHRNVNPVSDQSIHPHGDGHAIEVRVLAAEAKIAETILPLCSVLREARAEVNKSCGLHIHLDMRNRGVEQCYHNLFAALDLLYALVPLPRRTNTRYCARNIDSSWGSTLASGHRYVALNADAYRRHKTLEVRLHSGTVNPTKILNWIEICRSIADHPNRIVLPKTTAEMAEVWKWSPELLQYVNQRLMLFDDGTKWPFAIPKVEKPEMEMEGGEVSALAPTSSRLTAVPTREADVLEALRNGDATTWLAVVVQNENGDRADPACSCNDCATTRSDIRRDGTWTYRHWDHRVFSSRHYERNDPPPFGFSHTSEAVRWRSIWEASLGVEEDV